MATSLHRLVLPLLLSAPLAPLATGTQEDTPFDPTETRRASDEAFHRFLEGVGGALTPTFDAETGRFTEATGYARAVPYPIDGNNLSEVALDVVVRAEELLGVRAADLEEERALTVAGVHAVRYGQRLGGYPVRGARVDMRFGENGEIYVLRSSGLVREPLAATFRVPERDAGELARIAPPTTWMAYAWEPTRVVRPIQEGDRTVPRPAWEVRVCDPTQPYGSWLVTLDGETGVTLDVQEQTAHGIEGTIDGRSVLGGPQTTAGPPLVLPMVHMYVGAMAVDEEQLTDDTCDNGQSAISGDGSTVVWVADCGGGSTDLYIGAPDGSSTTLLLSNGATNEKPSLSDDGTRIFFESDVDGDFEIYRIQSDGTGLTQLTSNTADDRDPSAADDGSFCAYESDADGDYEICRVAADGSGFAQLTSNDSDDVEAWLAGDGDRIAWAGDDDGDWEIFVMDADGSSQTQLTFNQVEDRRPSLPDDGAKVLFQSRMSSFVNPGNNPGAGPTGNASNNQFVRARKGPFHVWEIDPDGSSLEQLTYGHEERDVVISGFGNCIAYSSKGLSGDDYEIVLMDLGTRLEFAVTDDTTSDRLPSVSDDCACGSRQSKADGDWEVWAWCALFASDITDEVGDYDVPVPPGYAARVSAMLRGEHARVYDMHPDQSNLSEGSLVLSTPASDVDLLFNPTGFDEYPTAQVMGYELTDYVHDYLAAVVTAPPLSIPTPLPFSQPLKVRVNIPFLVANAYYDLNRDDTNYFMGGGLLRPNTAFETVVYHEYGHFLDDQTPGGIDSGSACETRFARSEGIGDIVSIFTSGQGIVGRDFFGPGTWVRNYALPTAIPGGAGDRQWDCLDCPPGADGKPESHAHGQALAGFAGDLQAAIGPAVAQQLVLGAIMMDSPDMQKTVYDVFIVAASPAFGGTGDPATAPLYTPICLAAAKHGFLCPKQDDFGSHLCALGVCFPNEARHEVVVTEWLGATVTAFDGGCATGDDDGVDVPFVHTDGDPLTLTIKVKVDPTLRFTGRYGGVLPPFGAPNPLRHLYLNAWFFIDSAGLGPGVHVLGTGSGGPVGPTPGLGPDTVALDPDTWGSDTFEFVFDLMVPEVPFDSTGLLRFRLDYGEDCGAVGAPNCLMSPLLMGPCGPARFGEVEDYQFTIFQNEL